VDLDEPSSAQSSLPLAALIAREMDRQNLSLGDLAKKVRDAARDQRDNSGTTRQTVHNWRNGQNPRPAAQRWLAAALDLPLDVVADAARQQGEHQAEMKRRQILQLGVTATGAITVAALGDLLLTEPAAMARAISTGTIGSAAMDAIERDTEALIRDYETFGGANLLSPSVVLFRQVRQAYEAGQPLAIQQRLCRAAAQLALLVDILQFNAILQFDARTSRPWLDIAKRAAAEIGDAALQAWVLVGESFLPTYKGDHRSALTILERGQALVGTDHGLVSAIVAALRARAHASSGELRQFEAAVGQAERSFAMTSNNQPGFFTFSEAQLNFYRADSYARLGKPFEAEDAAKQALALYGDAPHFMDPALVRFDLAASYVQRKEIEEACRVGREALAIPAQHRSGPIISRSQELRSSLEAFSGDPAVREFNDFLRHALPAPSGR